MTTTKGEPVGTTQDKPYVQFVRGYDMTIHKYPNDFNLLAVIAQRAKRTESYANKNLDLGEALIGDYKNYGMTEQEYRTTKNRLQQRGFITCRTTNRGTIAKLEDTSIFNINTDKTTDELTGKQQAGNEQTTTNNNDKNEKKDNHSSIDANEVVEVWPEGVQV